MQGNGIEGRVALVTGAGAAGGIGFAVARALAAQGARVAIAATTRRIEDRLAELGDGHLALTADLTDSEAASRLFDMVADRLGPPSIVVNNAGMTQTGTSQPRQRVEEKEDRFWRRDLDLNVTTAFNVIRAALPVMQSAGYGRIVNVASVTGPVVAIEGSAAYAAGKAALCGLTRGVALENAARGITCNAVLPGWIETPSSSPAEIKAGNRCPTRRPGTPDEVAACCLFLASAGASYVNGAMLVVDGANSIVEMK